MRATIYARYSTDKQDFSSIGDQYRVCEEYAARQGWKITARHADEGISGAAIGNRPGFKAMIAAALRGEFDVLLVMELSRLSRSTADLNKTIDRLTFRGVRVVGVSNGYDTARKGHKLQAGVEGVMGESFRDMIRDKTYTALQGRAKDGLFAGGLPYGYRSVAEKDKRRLEIDEEQAQHVRWIYARFTEGWSPRKIAHELNAKGIKTARGKQWRVSALYGHPKYQTGILRNPIYIGRCIWNRSEWNKDPDTGIRARRERPASEWHTLDVPALAIIAPEVYEAAQAKFHGPQKRPQGRPPRTPLSGLLRCSRCDGAVVAISARSYGCATNKDAGPAVCAGVTVRRDILESRLVEIARDELLSDGAVEELRAEVARLQAEETRTKDSDQKAAKARLQTTQGEIDRLVDAIAAAGWSEALRERLKAAEEEKARLLATQAVQPPAPPTALIPRLVDHYREKVGRLPAEMRRDPDAARAALREMLGDVHLAKHSGHVWAEVPDLSMSLKLVAGAGFEPATFGL